VRVVVSWNFRICRARRNPRCRPKKADWPNTGAGCRQNRPNAHFRSSDNIGVYPGWCELPIGSDQRGCDVCDDHVGLAQYDASALFGFGNAPAVTIGQGPGRCLALAFCGRGVARHQRDLCLACGIITGCLVANSCLSGLARWLTICAPPSGMIAVPATIFSFMGLPEVESRSAIGALISRNDRSRQLLRSL
jgi:hypothetical protein